MSQPVQTPGIYLWIIGAFSLFVPGESRREWRREWEAEIINRWLLLTKWERLDAHSKFDLLKRVRGAFSDVLCFQNRRARLVFTLLNMLVAVLTGFGALQHFIVDGIGGRRMQPLLLSLAAMMVSALFITSGIALWRKWSSVRLLITLTAALSILVHVYGALPPHRNMGFLILIVGAGYGLLMWLGFEWQHRRKLVS